MTQKEVLLAAALVLAMGVARLLEEGPPPARVPIEPDHFCNIGPGQKSTASGSVKYPDPEGVEPLVFEVRVLFTGYGDISYAGTDQVVYPGAIEKWRVHGYTTGDRDCSVGARWRVADATDIERDRQLDAQNAESERVQNPEP